MKKSLIVLIILIAGISQWGCHKSTASKDTKPKYSNTPPAFAFSEEMHNFGSLSQGDVVSYTFIFKNTGGKDLYIQKVDAGCSCTNVKWPQSAIQPGQEGHIETTLNTSGESGDLFKMVTIYANTPEQQKELTLIGNVK